LAFIQFIVQFSKVIVSSPGGDDLFILTNSEELVKDEFELFSRFKFQNPAVSGPCPDSSFSILLRKGIVKDFF